MLGSSKKYADPNKTSWANAEVGKQKNSKMEGFPDTHFSPHH
jgi:hypothetical protein